MHEAKGRAAGAGDGRFRFGESIISSTSVSIATRLYEYRTKCLLVDLVSIVFRDSEWYCNQVAGVSPTYDNRLPPSGPDPRLLHGVFFDPNCNHHTAALCTYPILTNQSFTCFSLGDSCQIMPRLSCPAGIMAEKPRGIYL